MSSSEKPVSLVVAGAEFPLHGSARLPRKLSSIGDRQFQLKQLHHAPRWAGAAVEACSVMLAIAFMIRARSRLKFIVARGATRPATLFHSCAAANHSTAHATRSALWREQQDRIHEPSRSPRLQRGTTSRINASPTLAVFCSLDRWHRQRLYLGPRLLPAGHLQRESRLDRH